MKFRNHAIAAGAFTLLGSISGVMAQDSITTSTPMSASVQAYCTMQIDATGLTNNVGFYDGDKLFIYPYVACNAYGGAQLTVTGTNGGFLHQSSGMLIGYSVKVAVSDLDFSQTAPGAAGTIVSGAIGGNGGLAVASVYSDVEGIVTVTLQGATAYAGDYKETLGFTLSAIN